MAFGISGNAGGGDGDDFLPLLTYNAKAGRLKLQQRVEGVAGWETQESDISFTSPMFVMDLAAVRVGWLLFKAGMPPVKALAYVGHPIPPQPVGNWGNDAQGKPLKPRHGFVMHLMGTDRVLREFSANAGCVIDSMNTLHDAYLAAPEAAQGMVPVVKFAGTTEMKTKHGSNFAPLWEIVKWVPRPTEFGALPSAKPAPAPVAAAPAPVAAPAKAKVPEMDDEIPF